MDSQRFEKLIDRHKDAVYRQMIRVCGHREDAEDALAASILQAFKSFDQLGSDSSFRTWLTTIGRRICLRMKSNPKMQIALEAAIELGLGADEPAQQDIEVLKGCVKEAIDLLPEKYASLYISCEIEERSVPDVAAELGISVAAAKTRLLRARAQVRTLLDRSICSQV